MALLRKKGRSGLTRLPDGRKQVVDVFDVRSDAADPATLDTDVFIALGTAHQKYTDCYLDRASSLSPSGDQRAEQDLTRVYLSKAPTTATAIYGTARLIFPFARDGDLTTAEIHQDLIINKANYSPPTPLSTYSNEALLDPQPSGPLYLLGDYNQRDVGGNAIHFTRIWTRSPAARTIRAGSYPFRFPALPSSTAYTETPQTITAISGSKVVAGSTVNYSSSGGKLSILESPVFTCAGHGYSVGDVVKISITWDTGYPFQNPVVRNARIMAVTTNTFTISQFTNSWGGVEPGSWSPAGFTAGTVAELEIVRWRATPTTEEVDSYVVFDYAIPGVTTGVTDSFDFSAMPVFKPVVTATQEATDTLTAFTTPTLSEYATAVSAGSYIPIKSTVRRYRDSAILERETRYGLAT